MKASLEQLGPFRACIARVTASHIAASANHSHYAASTVSRGVSRQSVAEEPEEDFQSAFRKQLSARSDSQTMPAKRQEGTGSTATDSPAKAQSDAQERTSKGSRQHPQDSERREGAEDHERSDVSSQRDRPTDGVKRPSKGVQHDDDTAEHPVEDEQAALPDPSLSAAFPTPALIEPGAGTDNEHLVSGKTSNVDAASDTSCNPAEAATGDLAFAMRITAPGQSSEEATPAESEAEEFQQNTGASALRNQVETVTSNGPRAREADPPAIVEAATEVHLNSSPANTPAAPAEEVAKGSAHGFEAEFSKFFNQPVKSAHVQISGADNQRVDIRLQERGGALSVTVRSTDTKLTQSLQDRAPELNSRLAAEHFQSELWTPHATKTAQQRDANAGNGSPSQDRGKSPQQNPNQNQNGKKQPEWIEAVEAHSWASQKRIEYTWHQ